MKKSAWKMIFAAAALLVCCQFPAKAVPVLAPEVFLQITRSKAAQQNSFADLSGKVTHLKRNQGAAVSYPVRFLIRFGRKKVEAALRLNNSEEHRFERAFADDKSRSVCNVKGETLLQKMGFEISDLAMDFLKYPVRKEYKSERYKTLHCRVLQLAAPDGGTVKVWIASEYYFPLRAEFQGKVERTLEITGFEKSGDYYVASDIALLGSYFRTRIAFDDCRTMRADDPQAKMNF